MQTKKLLILILIQFLSVAVDAQNLNSLDSLKYELAHVENQEKKALILLELSDEFINNAPQKAQTFSIDALNIAIEIEHVEIETEALNNLAKIYFDEGKIEEAKNVADSALLLSSKFDLITEQIKAKRSLGYIFTGLGNYKRSSVYLMDALKMSEELGDSVQIAYSLNSIAYLFYIQGNNEKVILYNEKYISIARSINNKSMIANGLNNTSVTLAQSGEFENALPYSLEAIELNTELNNQTLLIKNYATTGNLCKSLMRYDTAMYFFNKALVLAKKLGNVEKQIDINLINADLLYETGNIMEGLALAKKSLRQAIASRFKNKTIDALAIIEKIHLDLNQYDSSYFYLNERFILQEQLDSLDNATELSKVEMIYNWEKKEKTEEFKQLKRDIAIIVIVSLLIISLVITVLLIKKYKLKIKFSSLEKQKLNDDLEFKNKELTLSVMSLLKKNELLKELSKELIEVEKGAIKDETKTAIKTIAKGISKNTETKIWDEFEVRFKDVHNDFYKALLLKFPDLTPNEQKLSALLRLNMTTKDVAELTGQSIKSIEVARYRLRKKFDIVGTEENLVRFLSKL